MGLVFLSLILQSSIPRITYAYTLHERRATRKYYITITEDGRLTYGQQVENAQPREQRLPSDASLAEKVFSALNNPRGFCGSPRNGTLTITRASGTVTKVDLSDPDALDAYGRIVILLDRRLHPDFPVVSDDCIPLAPPSPPEVLKSGTAVKKLAPEHPARSPKPFIKKIISARDGDAALAALYEIVSTRGSDPFFARHLLVTQPYSQEAADVADFYPAPAIYGVRTQEDTYNLLKSLKKIKSKQLYFYRALLYLRVYSFGPAAAQMRRYFSWIGLPAMGEKWEKRILSAQKLTGDINRGDGSWASQVMSVAALWKFWRDVAYMVSPPSPYMPALAWTFHFRAFHYARMFAGNPKVGSVPASPKGRRYLKKVFPLIAARPWWTLPYEVQYDLVTFMGVLRSWNRYFGGRKAVQKLIPPLDWRVTGLAASYRLSTALRLVEKNGRDPNMYVKIGMVLARLGRWCDAARVMGLAREGGADEHTEQIARALLECGRLDPSEDLEEDENIGYALYLLDRGHAAKALAILSRIPEKARTPEVSSALMRARLAENVPGAQQELAELAKKDEDARLLLADAMVASKAPFDTVYDLLIPSLYGKKGALAWGLLAIRSGSRMLYLKALDQAWYSPEALPDLLDLMARHGAFPEETLALAQKVHALLPYSARVSYSRALVFLRFGALDRAEAEISRALAQRPAYPPYLRLEKAVLRAKNAQKNSVTN